MNDIKLALKYFVLIVTVTKSTFLCAQQTIYSQAIPAGKAVLLENVVYANKHSVRVLLNNQIIIDKKNIIEPQSLHLIGPFKKNTKIDIMIEWLPIHDIEDLQRIKLHEIEEPKTISSYFLTETEINQVVKGLEAVEKKNTKLSHVFALSALNRVIKEGYLEYADRILQFLEERSADSIYAYCKLTEKLINDKQLLTNHGLVSLSHLAYDFYAYIRHNGELSSNANTFGKKHYDYFCKSLIDNLSSLYSEPLRNSSQDTWSLDIHTEHIFKFLLSRQFANDPLSEAKILSKICFLYYFKGNHDIAIQIASRALRLIEQTYDEYELKSALLNTVYSSSIAIGDVILARDSMVKALSIEHFLSKNGKSQVFYNLGLLYYYTGDYDLSIRYLNKALDIFGEGNQRVLNNIEGCTTYLINTNMISSVFVVSGMVNNKLQNWSLAQDHLNCAIGLAEKNSDHFGIVAKTQLAFTTLHSGQLSLAEQIAEKVLDDKRSHLSNIIDAKIVLFTLQIKRQNPIDNDFLDGLAKDLGYNTFYTKNFSFSGKYLLRQIDLFRLLMLLHWDQQDIELAELFAERAILLINKYETQITNQQAWRASTFAFISSYVELLVEQIEQPKKLEHLHYLLEDIYNLPLHLEKNKYQITKKDIGTKLFDKWIKLKRQAVLAKPSDRQRIINLADRIREELLTLKDKSNLSSKDSPRNILSLQQLQLKLTPEEIAIRYVVNNEKILAFVISNHDVSVIKIPLKKQKLEQLANEVKQGIFTNLQKKSVRRSLLPDTILENVTKLVIIPDQEISLLPFAALNIASNEKYYLPLASRYNSVMTTSFSSYFSNISYNPNTTEKVSVFAASSFGNIDSPFGPLPNTLKEVEYIKSQVSEERLQVAVGKDATNEFLLSETALSSQVLHIATHGFVQQDGANSVGLITQDELNGIGFLSLEQILSEPINNRLVVASGCETMQGKLYQGSGMRSLSRGLLTQGAGSVLGTLWPVYDKATAIFMGKFYKNLNATQNSTTALRLAQVEMSKYGRYKNPKYWAGFVLNSTNHLNEEIYIE